MAFNFPASPSNGDTYTANGFTYEWDGSKWIRKSPSTGAQGNAGAQGATGPTGAQGAAGAQGAQGHQGATGGTGATGAQGAQGHQGVTGSTGAQGATGSGGSTGAQGAEGNFGGATFYYTFESNTTNANPGSGDLRLDNSTQNAATGIYICDTDEDGTDIASYLQTIDDSTSTIKGHVKITNKLDSSQFLLFTISSLTDNTGYFDITVSPVDSSATSPFSANEDILITFARTGDKGDTGATGAQGATGSGGSTGAQGATGPTGAQGAQGHQGATGGTGAQGATGSSGSATISGNADNRVITGGSGTNLVGESTLTYDNPTLEINTDTSPYGVLNLNGNSGGLIQFEDNEVTKWSIFGDSTFSIYDNVGSAHRLRIDSAGRLLIGTATTKSAGSGQYAKLNVEGYAGGSECFASFSRAEAASAMSANDEVANLTFNDSAGYEFARIQVLADAATGATDTPGRMVFRTTADGASSSTERLRIDSSGNVNIGSNTSANPFTYLRFGASLYGAADIRPTNEANHKVGLSFYTDGTQDTTINPTERLRISSDGQIGVNNASPDAWHSSYKSIQIYDAGVLYGSQDDSFVGLGANHFLNTSGDFKYSNTDFASRFYQVNGGFHFESVASGTAGNTFSFTERLRITSSGDVGIGKDSPAGKLHISSGNSGDCVLIIEADEDNNNESDNPRIEFRQDGGVAVSAIGHGLLSGQQNGLVLANGVSTGYISFATGTVDGHVNAIEKLRIDTSGTLTNTTTSSHSQGAGTFEIKGIISQYSQGSGSGLIFDCDFGRITGYSDDANVTDGTNLSACLSHSTTDWSSSSSNTPMSVNGGQFQYRVGFGGYFDAANNGGRVSVGAGSGVPAFSDKLNTASMTIEAWVWYDSDGREVIASRYGSGFPNQFNMIADPNGQFHYNSSGVGASGGNISGEHFPDKTWHHHVWQYDAVVGTMHRWYINGAFANQKDVGSSLSVASGTGFAIFSRADRYEDWRGKIAIVRMYNRALSATEIKNHFELERGRFGV